MKDLSHIYNHLYKNGYDTSGRWKDIRQDMLNFPLIGKQVLDIGCGRGDYVLEMLNEGLVSYGTDIISPSLVKCPHRYFIADGYEYPILDYITCMDVLEHIPIEEVPDMLAGIADACSWAFVTIAHCEATNKGPNGEELHLTVEPWMWWKRQIKWAGMEVASHRYNLTRNVSIATLKGLR